MNKTAIKNFAIWARNKLITDINYRAGLLGITADGIHSALPQSTGQTQFYDIGTSDPYAITGDQILQRQHLVDLLRQKEKESDYKTAYKYVLEEVAYTWFNRLIAVRFMEVNDYLPSHIRVLSSESGKMEPDLVTTPFDADLEFTREEQQAILDLKNTNKLNEVFRLLFIKQCNALNEILPALFEKTSDYTELLLNLSVIDRDGVVWHLVHDIPESDFNVEEGGQVEIIGWLYQYYNTEPKNEAFAKKGKITKDEVPAVTQLFTPDWIVRYMVENSLGRLWVEGHPNEELKSNWKYYLEEAEQEPEVASQLEEIRKEYAKLNPEDIKVIDPCMGSGHILVYAFDVLMQIYESAGYGQRDAARSILENNIYGLDIDDRAFQIAYFAVMMKARQYNRRILNGEYKPNVYSIQESNGINRNQLQYFGAGLNELEKNNAVTQMTGLLDTFKDAKEFGSILTVNSYDWDLLECFVSGRGLIGQMSMDTVGLDKTAAQLIQLIVQGKVLAQKYHVTTTNPPYMVISNSSPKLNEYVKNNYPDSKADLYAVFIERCRNMTCTHGLQSMITMHSWMFITSFAELRDKIFRLDIVNMVHLGARAFEEIAGEVVQTTSFVFRKSQIKAYNGVYFRLVNKGTSTEKEKAFLNKEHLFTANKSRFSRIPSKPIAYWVNERLLNAYDNDSLSGFVECKSGIMTGSDQYIKLWFEPNVQNIKFDCKSVDDMGDCRWFPLNSGGEFRKWYGNNSKIVNLWHGGHDIIKNVKNYRLRDPQYYFKKGITWGRITTSQIAFREVAAGTLFGDAGPVGFVEKNRYYILGFLCSNVVNSLLQITNPTLNFQVHDIMDLPLIVEKESVEKVEEIVGENILY